MRRACRIVIGFQRRVWASLTCDEASDTGLLGRLVKVERLDKRIALTLTHDRCERPPDVLPLRVVWIVVKIVVDGLAQLAVLRPRRDGFVRARRREAIIRFPSHRCHPSPTAGITES